MDIKALILKKLRKNKEVRSPEIVKLTGFSRAYVNRFFRELQEEGVLTLTGKANKAKYIPASEKRVFREKRSIKKIHRILSNNELNEDTVFADIKKGTGIFDGLTKNVSGILEYAFSEMLNNAIEHSRSEKIEIKMERKHENVLFEVKDLGVGIFTNIKEKKGLTNEMDAIQDLLKGKQTTAPATHSGEGIFFTSKAGDIVVIQSSHKKLIFDNFVNDVFLRDVKCTKGTKIVFSIGTDSTKELNKIFSRYTDNSYQFNKTVVSVKLYQEGTNYVSRSQARRLMTGLEKFKTIVLDFNRVLVAGQAFADEIFRVWQEKHPRIKIVAKNTTDNVSFMIKRSVPGQE